MIKKFYRRSQAFHSLHGHSFFSIGSVFVCLYSKNNKTKTQGESFLSIFFKKRKWNLGRNLYIFIHPLVSSKSNELPQFGPPLKQMNG